MDQTFNEFPAVTAKKLVSNIHTGVNIDWKFTLEGYLWLFIKFSKNMDIILFSYMKERITSAYLLKFILIRWIHNRFKAETTIEKKDSSKLTRIQQTHQSIHHKCYYSTFLA